MKKLTGLSVSDGVAYGKLAVIPETITKTAAAYAISPQSIQYEQKRLRDAVKAAQEDIAHTLNECQSTDAHSELPEKAILEAHAMMLADEEFMRAIYADIENALINAESALKRKLDEMAAMLIASGDNYLCERAVDIQDAYSPVFFYLDPNRDDIPSRFTGVPQGALLAGRAFKPSEALEIKHLAPCGILMEEGGATSHISILARAWNIPTLIAVQGLMNEAKNGMYALLNAADKTVILEPDAEILVHIEHTKNSQIEQNRDSKNYACVYTQDGVAVRLSTNIALVEEAEQAAVQHTAGIGLFRSEFLFLGSNTIPTEDEQYAAYRTILERMGSKPVAIRTFDAGADKMLKEQETLSERNALLGWRGIRFCLDRTEIFKTQLRALLRAGAIGNLRILLPMISCKKEITAVRNLIKEIETECAQCGTPYKKNIPLGIMIEVPSAAIAADLYAPAVDFFSIGTNDLIQYTMAADRENQTIAHLADCFDPAVLRLIRHVIEAAALLPAAYGVCGERVSMCGEMASCVNAVPLLLGMGLRSLSMAAQNIPDVARRISSIKLSDAQQLYDEIRLLDNAQEIRRRIEQRFPHL